ncbi:18978_t:CDS:2 [Dentiscutata erythropus]|uniref:18978_t:CDS:1 n=1 Tax=Dentiscutata erythropus TaxID=1348616 RepID=A0A9N9NAX2_9GLOM|nr:18978_t:CDS:2 [Dentiscutata erythropus]
MASIVQITPITKDQLTFISNLCVPLNIISLISTVTSCMTFGLIRIYYPNLADRVSFRLSFAALFCDIGFSSHLLLAFVWNSTPGFLCGYSAWAIVFFDLSSLFFIVCIALNLHIIFLNEYRRSYYNFEKYYFIIAISFALLLSLLPLTADIKLRSVKKEIDDGFGSNSTSHLSNYPTLINKTVISSVVRRVMWYPVVPLIAEFCNSFVETYAYINRVLSYPLFLFCFVGMSLQEWLRYMLLIRLFSAPKIPARLASYELLSPINSFAGNKSNTSSAPFGKDDSKQDITLENQNDDQDIHYVLPELAHLKNSSRYSSVDIFSHYLNTSTSSDPLIDSNNQTIQSNISNIRVPLISATNMSAGDDEGRINVMQVNSEPTDIDLSQEIEMFKLVLKRL